MGAVAGGYRQRGGGGRRRRGGSIVREVAETNKPAAATREATISFPPERHQSQDSNRIDIFLAE